VTEFATSRRRWRSLHWFWLAPALIVVPAICLLMCAGLVAYGPITLKLSQPYRIASERVRYDDTVIAALGEPVEEAVWLPDGQITSEEGRTEAWFDFDVAGPNGKANVYAIAEKQGDTWVLMRIEVTFPSGQRQDLEL
jgi:hypothetical protein